ncbi:MAG: terminase gpA endonuclease subunit [Pseudomonadota bacterium]
MLDPRLIEQRRRENCKSAIARGLESARLPPVLSLSRWAEEHFKLSPETSSGSNAGDWVTLPYQRAIMDCLGCDDVEILDWWKCAQVGATKIGLAFGAYNVAYRKRSGTTWQPTKEDRNEYSQDHIDPMLRDCDAVSEQLAGDHNKQGPHNKVTSKGFLGAKWYIRGAHAGGEFRRMAIDWGHLDELDGYPHDIDGEGDPSTLALVRLTTSEYPKLYRSTTVTSAGASLMELAIASATMVFEFYVTCPHCRERQRMYFKHLKWKKKKNGDLDESSVRYECEHCEYEWRFSEIWRSYEGSRWQSECGHWIETTNADPILRDPDGMVVGWPRHIGFKCWSGISCLYPWERLVREFLAAKDDYRLLKAFTNTRLAELWEHEGDQVEGSMLFAKREPYSRPPVGVLAIVTTVDVQDNRLELLTCGWGRLEEGWVLDSHTIWGDPRTQEPWGQLTDYISQNYRREDGAMLRISAVTVDMRYLGDYVIDWAARRPHGNVYCFQGSPNFEAQLVSPPSDKRSRFRGVKVPVFTVGASVAKQVVLGRMQHTLNTPLREAADGYLHFPSTLDEEFFEQLGSEKLVRSMVAGTAKYKWVKLRDRNEALDLMAAQYAALTLLRPQWEVIEKRLLGSEVSIEDEQTQRAQVNHGSNAHRTARRNALARRTRNPGRWQR